MEVVNVFWNLFRQLLDQLVRFLPRVVVSVAIWSIGRYFLGLARDLIRKVNLKGTRMDDKITKSAGELVWVVGKFLLILIILDYLGIGRTVIGAFVNGLTFAIAICLGIAFGEALKPDARELVGMLRKQWKK